MALPSPNNSQPTTERTSSEQHPYFIYPTPPSESDLIAPFFLPTRLLRQRFPQAPSGLFKDPFFNNNKTTTDSMAGSSVRQPPTDDGPAGGNLGDKQHANLICQTTLFLCVPFLVYSWTGLPLLCVCVFLSSFLGRGLLCCFGEYLGI